MTAVPGSMPSTFNAAASGFRLRQLSCVDIEIGEDLGYVVELFQHVHEADDTFRLCTFDPNGIARNHRKFCGLDLEPLALQSILYGMKCRRTGGDEILVRFSGEIFRSALESRLQGRLLVVTAGKEIDLTLTVEHPRH